MKEYILVLCVLLFMRGMAYGIVAAELEKLKNSCLKKTGATEDTARKLIGVNVVTDSQIENATYFPLKEWEESLDIANNKNCFLTCLYRGLKLVSPDNKFLPDAVKKIADDHFLGRNLKITYQIADACSKEIKADPGEKCSIGGSFRNCFSKYGKELGFFPHI